MLFTDPVNGHVDMFGGYQGRRLRSDRPRQPYRIQGRGKTADAEGAVLGGNGRLAEYGHLPRLALGHDFHSGGRFAALLFHHQSG